MTIVSGLWTLLLRAVSNVVRLALRDHMKGGTVAKKNKLKGKNVSNKVIQRTKKHLENVLVAAKIHLRGDAVFKYWRANVGRAYIRVFFTK